MLIGIDASRLTRPRPTGTEIYSRHVVEEVLRQDLHNRFRLYFNAPPSQTAYFSERAEVRSLPLARLWTHLALSREMMSDPPDLLFVPTHVLPLALPRRSAVVIYDVGHRFFPRAHRLTEWLYVEWAIRRQVRVADAIITISEASRQDILRLYGRHGARPERISVAYPAVDSRFSPRAEAEIRQLRERYGLPPKYALYLGTVKPRKNLPRLIRAFSRAKLPADTWLVMAGDTAFGQGAVVRAVGEAGLGGRVLQLGYVDVDDVPALYSGAVCVALPSLHEGFGIPALEALACGAPLVSGNRGALPEIVGSAAELVDPLDVSSIARGLEAVVGDPRRSRQLRELGPPRAASFRWEDAGRTIVSVLNAVGQPPV